MDGDDSQWWEDIYSLVFWVLPMQKISSHGNKGVQQDKTLVNGFGSCPNPSASGDVWEARYVFQA